MSRYLRDSAYRQLQNASQFIQKGRHIEALKLIQKAEKTALKLEADDITLLAITLKGHLKQEMREEEEAFKIYAFALEMNENFVSKNPDNPFFHKQFSQNISDINKLADMFFNSGRFSQATLCCEHNILISQKMLEYFPQNPTYQFNVAAGLNNLGELLRKMGHIEKAKENIEKALKFYEEIIEKYPENSEFKSGASDTINNLGIIFSDIGRLDEAEKMHERALKMRQKILENNPKNIWCQAKVATTLSNLGNLLHFKKLFENSEDKYKKALEMRKNILKKYPEEPNYLESILITFNNLGALFFDAGRVDESKKMCEKALEICEKLLKIDSKNIMYQLYVGAIFNNLGSSYSDTDIEKAEEMYKRALEIYEKLLAADPKNLKYQSEAGKTLNNLGNFLSNRGRIEDSKYMYQKALEVFKEPLQYLTVFSKSYSIIRLIELNTKQAGQENDHFNQMKYLREIFKLCRENQEFFIKYELKYERKLVTEAGLSAYIDFLIKNVRFKTDSRKRAQEYEKALKAVEKLNQIEDDKTVSKMFSSAVFYFKGRILVNEALASRKPDIELLKQAVEQFRSSKETYDKANVCFCVYTGLIKVLEKIEILEEVDVLKLKKIMNEVIATLPEDVYPSIRASFENIPHIFEENDIDMRKELMSKLNEQVSNIEYKALEYLFGHVLEKIKYYFEDPFHPNLIYNNWKLRIPLDAEKIKGKLTVKAGNTILFDQMLSREEIKDNEIEIDYLEKKYIPSGKDVIIFETPHQKSVAREIDYSETISTNKRASIFLHNFSKGCSGGNLRIAAVQLRYDVYSEDSVVKVLKSETYKQKIMEILGAVKEEVDIVVFPEFSIPLDYLEDIQKYTNETGIIVFAGTHYITEEYLGEYQKLFASDFEEEDFRKNICPVVIPNSKIIHSEKMFGAKEERALFYHKGMRPGKLNHIFKLWDNLNIGVLICFEYLNDELRHRLVSACDIILVPQTNPNPERFYETAKHDLNNPICAGNKVYIMANGIFRIGKVENDKFKVEKDRGGSSGVLLTLDKDSNRMLNDGIIYHKEQFVLLANINLKYSAARDIQIAPEPIKTTFIHIFEEEEILLYKKESAEKFLSLIKDINASRDRKELKNLITENKSLIAECSPFMYDTTVSVDNLTFDELKESCRSILIRVELCKLSPAAK